MWPCKPSLQSLFLSTPSARRATKASKSGDSHSPISIHALREEGDDDAGVDYTRQSYFYPRPPRGGRQLTLPNKEPRWMISIHALREEGDQWKRDCSDGLEHFYPRPPRGGRRTPGGVPAAHRQFLSTPSARRATLGHGSIHPRKCNFYPRPPRGGRHSVNRLFPLSKYISIHALREEGDFRKKAFANDIEMISIHALREEGDQLRQAFQVQKYYISIHALREEGDVILQIVKEV